MIAASREYRPRALLPDQRGAMMLMATFMAIFMVCLLYYVVGISDAIWHRGRMQDAADAAAFSAATAYARGMNLLVLINLVMAGLLAILVALKLLETLIMVAIIILTVLSIWNPLAASAIAPLTPLRTQVSNFHDQLEPTVTNSLEALNQIANVVRQAVPIAAQVQVMARVVEHYQPQATTAFAIPSRLTLPTMDGDFGLLCDEAAAFVGEVAAQPLSAIPPAHAAVKATLGALASAGTAWYCKPADNAAPSTKHTYDRFYPRLRERQACLDATQSGSANWEALCEAAAAAEQLAEYDRTTGDCISSCGPGSPFARRIAQAKMDCLPEDKERGDLEYDGLINFVWQEQHVVLHRTASGETFEVRREQPVVRQSRRGGNAHPCGHDGTVSETYAPAADTRAGAPVCSWIAPHDSSGLIHTIHVPHILGCAREVTETIEVPAVDANDAVSESSGSEDGSKSPQVLEEHVRLGGEDFQIRAVVPGSLPSERPGKLMEAATGSTASPLAVGLQNIGRLSVAQAEYYFDAEDPESADPSRYMWNMDWVARLRRFRLADSDSTDESAGDACEDSESEDCAGIDDTLSTLDSVILH